MKQFIFDLAVLDCVFAVQVDCIEIALMLLPVFIPIAWLLQRDGWINKSGAEPENDGAKS